jgi:hypothetical protein
MWRHDGKVVLANVCPARTRIDAVRAPPRSALEGVPMDVIHHSEIGTQNAMTETTNYIQVLLNSRGRSQHLCPQYNECAMVMKAEMGSSSKAMIRSVISFYNAPNEQKTRNTSDKGKQKNNLAGTAKKRNRKDRVAQRSLVAAKEKDSVTDSNEDPSLSLEELLLW